MTSILEELFYGNVCPGTDFRSKDAKTRKLMAHLADHHEALSGTLTDKQKELLEKFDDCYGELTDINEREIFVYAFRLGARIAIEVLYTQTTWKSPKNIGFSGLYFCLLCSFGRGITQFVMRIGLRLLANLFTFSRIYDIIIKKLTEALMNKEWNLDILYSGFDDPKYNEDTELLTKEIKALNALSSDISSIEEEKLVSEYIAISEKLNLLASKLGIFANLKYSANTKDSEAASALGRLMGLLSATAAPSTKISQAIAKIGNLDAIIAQNPALNEYRYMLNNIQRDSKHLLSDKEEELFAKMNISGAGAWSDLQSSLTSSVTVTIDGKEIPLSSARNLAYSPDPETRKKAYEAELACYDKIKDSVAFALNSIKLQVLNECEMRGYESPLAKTLYTSRMKKETLDALLSAMEEYMPVFRKYLKAKAKALGHKGALPWYDLFAPMGKNDKKYSVEDARNYLLNIFRKFDVELYEMVKSAFDNAWIDFYPREGKVGGAFDCGVPSAKQSRVLTNFDGSFSDVVTLAHELGHSFHDSQVFKNSILNQDYSMPVAETASTFNEVLVMSTAIKEAVDKDEKIALIESELMDACQIICDIYSRFTFEASVFENRADEFMGADRLSSLMLAAQKKAYGDGLDEDYMHQYMWLCKGHYYSGGLSFYNFPYAFGGLFARGLYAKYEKEGRAFVDTYKEMLRATAVMDIEDCAKIAGIDLTNKEFWCEGLEVIKKEIDEFCELVQ